MIVCCWSLFFGFPLACCSDQDETLATVVEYQTPAGTLLQMETCVFFCFDIYPQQEKPFFPRHSTRQQLAGHSSGSVFFFFSPRPTMRFFFCLYTRAKHTLRARVCKRLWTHSTVNLAVPTLQMSGIIFLCRKVATKNGQYLVTDLSFTKARSLRRTLC